MFVPEVVWPLQYPNIGLSILRASPCSASLLWKMHSPLYSAFSVSPEIMAASSDSLTVVCEVSNNERALPWTLAAVSEEIFTFL